MKKMTVEVELSDGSTFTARLGFEEAKIVSMFGRRGVVDAALASIHESLTHDEILGSPCHGCGGRPAVPGDPDELCEVCGGDDDEDEEA
ncbi:hypothetical protein ACFVAJ_18030 [Agromyces sp. NPDC057679]|uniref:hypothetical protein n=1 Tax=Agromyces sp. NPDC057679 TaxID=3346207 RepID=UPI00366F9DFA